MKDDIKTLQRRINERDWSGLTEYRCGSVKSAFNSEVYTLETWLDNNPDSVRVGQQLDDLITLLKTMRIMTESTDDSLYLSEKVKQLEKMKENWE